MNLRDTLGVHLRFQDSLSQLLDEAATLQLKVMQFFLTRSNKENRGTYATLTRKEIAAFVQRKNDCGVLPIIHSSYWINLASGSEANRAISRGLLEKELWLAEQLEAPFLVLHPGSATKFQFLPEQRELARLEGMKALASVLNDLLAQDRPVTILLENTAHGDYAIGSNLEDFSTLKGLLTAPEKIQFCFDTAHAHAFGYNLTQPEALLEKIDKYMGLGNLKLVHFNDSCEPHGTHRDQHAVPGLGLIGKSVLEHYLTTPAMADLPKILELPKLSPADIHKVIDDILSW